MRKKNFSYLHLVQYLKKENTMSIFKIISKRIGRGWGQEDHKCGRDLIYSFPVYFYASKKTYSGSQWLDMKYTKLWNHDHSLRILPIDWWHKRPEHPRNTARSTRGLLTHGSRVKNTTWMDYQGWVTFCKTHAQYE